MFNVLLVGYPDVDTANASNTVCSLFHVNTSNALLQQGDYSESYYKPMIFVEVPEIRSALEQVGLFKIKLRFWRSMNVCIVPQLLPTAQLI